MKRVEWANALRGVAALTVLVAHFGVVFWMNQTAAASLARREQLYPGDSAAPRFARLLAAIPVDFGALGVALFFLLSGYVIAISLDRYSRRGFLIGRVMRVIPTYAAGFLMTCAVIWAISDPNHELIPGHVLSGTIPGLSIVLGVNSPADGIVWTLIVELVFYVVCLLGYRSLTRRWYAILAAGLACAAVQFLIKGPATHLGQTIGGLSYLVLLACPFLPVMLIGVALSAHRRGQLGGRATALLVPVLAAIHLTLLTTTTVVPTPLRYRLTFVGAIAAFTAIWAVGDHWRAHPVPDFFADISYPLYVVHPVLGYTLLSLLAAGGLRAPAAVLVTTATVIVSAWLLHQVVEVPTHRLGQRWARSIAYRPPVEASAVAVEGQPETVVEGSFARQAT